MSNNHTRRAVYTGSFDPITLGHVNVIERGSRLVDQLIVGVGVNVEKSATFSPDERVRLIEEVTAHLYNVTLQSWWDICSELDQLTSQS